jgi:peptidyl-prolyl cis-trans isomerase SurA
MIQPNTMKRFFFICVLVTFVSQAFGQVLFTYGDKEVDASEFLRAFNKNNQAVGNEREKAIRDYLDLYILSRLKIEEAYRRGYDTIPHLKNEVNNLRNQIAENYMNDPSAMDRLSKEAFLRSQKDIRVSHIFISLKDANGQLQQEAAEQKKNAVLERLRKGEEFSKLAKEMSDDPLAKNNGGDLGYITVFTLPYEFENAIYNARNGTNTSPILSKAGYHIFRRVSERKAAGKMKAAQILLAYPPNIGENEKKAIAKLADSLYKRLLAGDKFNELALAFSNDYVSAANGGIMPDIGVGQFDPKFETALWNIAKDGGLARPFETSHGWHIVKRLEIKPVNSDSNARAPMADLRNRIVQDSRWNASKDFIFDVVRTKAGFKKLNYDQRGFTSWADSVLDGKPMGEAGKKFNPSVPLFQIGDSNYTASDWFHFAQVNRFRKDGSGVMPQEMVSAEFERSAMVNYYRDHLEEFNPEFKAQMTEFRDGNLFFEIMQTEIWNKAQMDTAALASYYAANMKDYMWKKSVDAILFFCSDAASAKQAHADMKKNPADWRAIVERNIEKVVADSSRFEIEQIPNLSGTTPKAGSLTDPFINETDGTTSFAFILRVNNNQIQRSFSEARGMVINDYQAVLEKAWNETLKKKYPVKINEKTLAALIKSK